MQKLEYLNLVSKYAHIHSNAQINPYIIRHQPVTTLTEKYLHIL